LDHNVSIGDNKMAYRLLEISRSSYSIRPHCISQPTKTASNVIGNSKTSSRLPIPAVSVFL